MNSEIRLKIVKKEETAKEKHSQVEYCHEISGKELTQL